jgi:D-alanine-D-alanine ligase
MSKINLAVIFGGKSGEHEVSLSSAISILKTLDRKKYDIIPIAITKNGDWLFGDNGQKYIDLNFAKAGKEGSIKPDDPDILRLSKESIGFNDFMKAVRDKKIDLVFPIIHGPFGEDGRIQGFLDIIGIPYVFSGVLAHAIAMNKPKAKILVKNCGVPVPEGILIERISTSMISLKKYLSLFLSNRQNSDPLLASQ